MGDETYTVKYNYMYFRFATTSANFVESCRKLLICNLSDDFVGEALNTFQTYSCQVLLMVRFYHFRFVSAMLKKFAYTIRPIYYVANGIQSYYFCQCCMRISWPLTPVALTKFFDLQNLLLDTKQTREVFIIKASKLEALLIR